ncbi:HAMP domain-containing histidine kinase [Nocardia sp. CDC159]|uniref:Signal transduction histidine-protein kinase/phosphatase MprB n=1 Tax=Nocardia pulmonis TaxID=2951408 RepID=A0A9X2EA70_9NOCA|nr:MULTISPECIES: HAMP domain-containing sensor histidine kinase [Nocardia]MCM6774373.1 HAMP domain-containing histidine kinase [Nocardia pulmonis]MCM6787561.1 HAMP domain-containing histidine kinase [Nocardia sp. CDC159]
MTGRLSLRTRVALASAATAALVVTAMSAVFFALAPSGTEQQMATAVRSLRLSAPAPNPTAPEPAPAPLAPGSGSPGTDPAAPGSVPAPPAPGAASSAPPPPAPGAIAALPAPGAIAALPAPGVASPDTAPAAPVSVAALPTPGATTSGPRSGASGSVVTTPNSVAASPDGITSVPGPTDLEAGLGVAGQPVPNGGAPRFFLTGAGAGESVPAWTWDLPAAVGHGNTVVVAAAIPRQALVDTVAAQRLRIVAVGGGAIAAAAALGWFFAHRAVLPLRRLTAATKGVGTRLSLDVPPSQGSTETAELAAAMNQMLERIAAERRHTADALAAARDFAATSAHELRTPLTSMRTDLQVLRTMDMPEPERLGILDDVLSTQQSVEDTLAALERLALGELTTDDDFGDVDLDELIDQVVEDARRAHPELTIAADVPEPLRIRGLAAGLRSIVENAVTNSVRHGRATRVDIDARIADDTVELAVDDDGCGVPPADRERLFERFARGATTAAGSGLGLALVAQQARLHGGTVCFEDSPHGGARLCVTLRAGDLVGGTH